MSSNVIRWGGLSALLSGVLMVVAALISPDIGNPNSTASPLWVPSNVMFGIGALLGLFGLIVIYNRVATDAVALVGFVLAFIGTTVFVGFLLVMEAFVVPAIAATPSGKALVDPYGPLFMGPLGIVLLILGSCFALGFILIGIAIWRTKALPRWAGVLAAVGAPVIAFTPPLPGVFLTLGGVLFGLGVGWQGYAIWSKK